MPFTLLLYNNKIMQVLFYVFIYFIWSNFRKFLISNIKKHKT